MYVSKSGFGLIGLLIAVAIIATLAGGGVYFWETQQIKSQFQVGLEAEKKAQELRDKILQQQRQRLEGIGEKSETSQPSQIDTSNWKTYRNEKYGFEVRYIQQILRYGCMKGINRPSLKHAPGKTASSFWFLTGDLSN